MSFGSLKLSKRDSGAKLWATCFERVMSSSTALIFVSKSEANLEGEY